MILYPIENIITLNIEPTTSLDTLYNYINQIENLIFERLNNIEYNSTISNDDIYDKENNESTMNENNLEDIFDEDTLLDMEEEIYNQIYDYDIENTFNIDVTFKQKITELVTENMIYAISFIYENDNENNNDEVYSNDKDFSFDETEIYNFVKERVDTYFEYIFPNIHFSPHIPKSIKIDEFDKLYNSNYKDKIPDLQNKIKYLKSVYQPEQRTPEWYEFRNSIMTASNIYKIFGTQSQFNSFICEKCIPVSTYQEYVNPRNTRHWGQKYEKLSIKIYESIYNTEVTEFGCIKHNVYEYIGASPDGIVTGGSNNEHFGRMIEIKNIVNREITGVPLEAYWIQMQIQMEVCDLDICNFIETRFKECQTTDEWKIIEKTKGITITNIPISSFEYVTPEYKFIIYSEEIMEEYDEFIKKWNSVDVEIKWWYMDEFSCVVVPRNKEWFKFVLPKLTEAWNIILHEKETGEYKQRLPKKKILKTKCLLQLENEEQNTNINETVKTFHMSDDKIVLNRNTVVVKDI